MAVFKFGVACVMSEVCSILSDMLQVYFHQKKIYAIFGRKCSGKGVFYRIMYTYSPVSPNLYSSINNIAYILSKDGKDS